MQNNWSALLLVVQFVYNITLQKGIKILPFKANYSYLLKILLLLRQVKRTYKIAKKRINKLMDLY